MTYLGFTGEQVNNWQRNIIDSAQLKTINGLTRYSKSQIVKLDTWKTTLLHYSLFSSCLNVYLRGCSLIISAQNREVRNPPPLCQPMSAVPWPPLSPLSANVSIWPPPFVASVLKAYSVPPCPCSLFCFLKKLRYLTKKSHYVRMR